MGSEVGKMVVKEISDSSPHQRYELTTIHSQQHFLKILESGGEVKTLS